MISPRLESFLRSWHETSAETQRKNGKEFNLSFEEFLSLWSPQQLRRMQKWSDDNNLYLKLSAENEDAYVLTWTSYRESQGPVMHVGNAQILKRKDSLKVCRVAKGDTLPEKTRSKISRTLTGMVKEEDHKRKISVAMQGVHKGRKGTKDESANKSAAQKARWDRYRAEKAAKLQGDAE